MVLVGQLFLLLKFSDNVLLKCKGWVIVACKCPIFHQLCILILMFIFNMYSPNQFGVTTKGDCEAMVHDI